MLILRQCRTRSCSIQTTLIHLRTKEMKAVRKMMKLIFLVCVFARHALTGSLSRTEKPFTWRCGIDICTIGVHYCDDISEPAVCERCNEDVCNRQFPPRQCLQTCHPTDTDAPTSTRSSLAEQSTGSWAIPVSASLGVTTFVLSISLTIVTVCYCRECRQRKKTTKALAQPTTPPEYDTCERAVSTTTYM